MSSTKAVCLLSGGLDSAVATAYARYVDIKEVYPLIIHYGQRHAVEVEKAKELCTIYFDCQSIEKVVRMDHPGGSALTGDEEVPLDREDDGSIPVTYVPGRNLIFLSMAAAYAESIGASTIYTGFNTVDYSGYPDCRPEFVSAFNDVLPVALKDTEIIVKAPLIDLSKKQIIELGHNFGIPFELTWSCYSGGDVPCGKCDSCVIRAKGFEDAGRKDPALLSVSKRR